jgi:hypothetical protein
MRTTLIPNLLASAKFNKVHRDEFGLAGAVFGATASWFQGAVRWFGGALSTVRNNVRLPEIPTLPQDLSGIWIGYWVVLAVVVFSLIAGAGIMRWAMKED